MGIDFFSGCAHDDDDNDNDSDDVSITVVEIIIIITAVGSQMQNSECFNWIHATAGEKIHFRSDGYVF